MAFFSVVIPTYNRADLVATAINSVLKQTFADFELIVVDNASTDNSAEVINAIQDSRIIFIQNPVNLERCASRNIGAAKAAGKYVTFLDSDDYYLDNHLQTFYNEISAKDFPVGMFFVNRIVSQNNELSVAKFAPLTKNTVEYFFVNSVISSQICIARSILDKFSFRKDAVVFEDAVLEMEIANEYPIYQINKETNVYLIHDTMTSNVKANNAFKMRLQGLNVVLKNQVISSKLSKDAVRMALSECYLGIYKYYFYQGAKLQVIKTLLQAILLYPDVRLKYKLYLLFSELPVTSTMLKSKEKMNAAEGNV